MSGSQSHFPADDANARFEQLENAMRDTQTQQQQTQQLLLQILSRVDGLTATMSPQERPAAPTSPTAPEAFIDPILLNSPLPANSSLRPAMPNDFDGSRASGKAFLTSCRLYFNLCSNQFPNDQVRIHWVLSFMKSGRAASFAQSISRRSAEGPVFTDWHAFEKEFRLRFCPRDEQTVAVNKLEGMSYYQGRRPVDDYIDYFEDLVAEAGYTEGRVIVMRFRRGLDSTLQDRIAEMGVDRPSDDNPQEWYDAARRFDANRVANRAFNATGRQAPAAPTSLPRVPLPPQRSTTWATPVYAPPPGPPPRFSQPAQAPTPRPVATEPIPMDVDAMRRKRAVPGACYRCGSTEHLVKDCPRPYDIRAMSVDEQTALLEQLLAAADVREAEMTHMLDEHEGAENSGPVVREAQEEDFGSSRG